MAEAGYTTIYNAVMRDIDLTLPAKGLYAVIKSLIGLPGLVLSKRRLAYACSDSRYQLNKAWKELKDKGYLQHLFSTAENGAFCHAYNLMQQAGEAMNYVYSPEHNRPNGDCAFIAFEHKDYTNIPTDILRDKTISLADKGLYALVSALKKIPGFILRPEGVRSFCQEKLKHFSTLWKKFKIAGLLKQHRYPAGEERNHWSYEYELCETPDRETPYLVNHHYDGSVSTFKTIGEYLEKFKAQISNITRRKPCVKDKPRAVRRKERRKIEQQLDAEALRRKYGNVLTGHVVSAVYNISCAPQLTVQGAQIAQERRKAVALVITSESVQSFLDGVSIDYSRVKNPVAYLQTALFAHHEKLLEQPVVTEAEISPDSEPAAERPLADWEQIWLAQKADARKRRKEAIARGEYQD